MAAADDFYLKHGYGGHFGGRTLIQAHGKIGGHRSVFINLVSGNKDAFVYPPFGGVITNPFKGRAKAYAGDFCEYDPGNHLNGKYCTMCGPNFCAMRISQNLKSCEFDPEEEARLHEE